MRWRLVGMLSVTLVGAGAGCGGRAMEGAPRNEPDAAGAGGVAGTSNDEPSQPVASGAPSTIGGEAPSNAAGGDLGFAGGEAVGGLPAGGDGGSAGADGCADSARAIGDIRVPRDYPTIQGAIAAAKGGDTISVGPGTYPENIDFSGKAIRLVSELGAAKTIINGTRNGAVATFTSGEGRSSVIDGFTLQNGWSSYAGGIRLVGASPTIVHNVFVDNHQGGGGAGIEGNNASPWIEGNKFSNNSCDDQFLSGVVVFVNGSSPVVVDNLFIDNACRALNLTVVESAKPMIFNNTIVNNHMGIHISGGADTSLETYSNNIIFGGDVGLEVVFPSNKPLFSWSHNLVYGSTQNFVGVADPTGTDGNVSVDPKLADVSARDLRLLPSSPAIDAGAVAPALPEYDFYGEPRVVDGNGDGLAAVDIGASEFSADACR